MNHFKLTIRSLMLLALLVFQAGRAVAVDIALRQKVTPVKSVIVLGDIADVTGADFATTQQLLRTPLWIAPPVGETRFVTPQQVFDLLVSRGYAASELIVGGTAKLAIGWQKPENRSERVERSPSRNVINRPTGQARPSTGFRTRNVPTSDSLSRAERYQMATMAAVREEQTQQEVKAAAIRYLETQTGLDGLVDVELSLPNRYSELLAAREGKINFSGGRSPWIGRQTLKLDFMTSAGPLNLSLPVASYDLTPVLVAKRPIARGQLITAADVAVETPARDARFHHGQTKVYDLEEALGKESSRAFRPGDLVTAESCLPPMMVERGAIVDVIASGGGIVVRRQAKAMSDARMGDVIEAELLDGSRERLVGRVVGSNQLATMGSDLSAPVPVPGQSRAGYR